MSRPFLKIKTGGEKYKLPPLTPETMSLWMDDLVLRGWLVKVERTHMIGWRCEIKFPYKRSIPDYELLCVDTGTHRKTREQRFKTSYEAFLAAVQMIRKSHEVWLQLHPNDVQSPPKISLVA